MTPRMSLAAIAVIATALTAFVAPTAAIAQHGAPFELRNMTPTIEHAAPGREPAPEEKIVPETYRRQPVFYRTNAPETIGHAVSSGCFRLVNEQVTDLYERVPVGTKVIVQQ